MTLRPLLLLLLSVAGPALAAEDPCLEEALSNVEAIRAADATAAIWPVVKSTLRPNAACLLGSADTSGMGDAVGVLRSMSATPSEKTDALGELLQALDRHLDDPLAEQCPGPDPRCIAGRHRHQIGLLIEWARSSRIEDSSLRDAWVLRDGVVAVSDVDISNLVEASCEDGLGPDCRVAVDIAARVVRTTLAANEVITARFGRSINAAEAFVELRDAQWEVYLNGASVQYPWELAVNGGLFRRAEANQGGFPQPPSRRLVVLHPSVGVESIENEEGNRQQAVTVLLEVLGYQRWRWSDSEQKQRWGVSAILSLADVDGMDDVGFGALIHTPLRNTAIGVVWRDGDNGSEVGITLNVDLAKLVYEHGTERMRRFVGAAAGGY